MPQEAEGKVIQTLEKVIAQARQKPEQPQPAPTTSPEAAPEAQKERNILGVRLKMTDAEFGQLNPAMEKAQAVGITLRMDPGKLVAIKGGIVAGELELKPDEDKPIGELVKTLEDAMKATPPRIKDEAKESSEVIKTSGSIANAPHTVAAALCAADEYLGSGRKWEFGRDGQAFAGRLDGLNRELPSVSDLLQSIAGKGPAGVKAVNEFLQKKGFSIQLVESTDRNGLYVASVLDEKVSWKFKGDAAKLKLKDDEREVDAVSMPWVRSVLKAPGHENPIVQIETQGRDKVFMTKYDKPIPQDTSSLNELVKDLSKSMQPAEGYKGVTFPMVDFNNQGDMKELIGAHTVGTDGQPAVVAQAKYQHRLRMNEVGARAEAAAAMGMPRGISMEKPVKIDGPFIVWFERDGVIPFAARITKDHMKRPANLD